MVDKHFQSFYDDNNAMFVESTSRSDPYILLRFINKKKDGLWEKPLNREEKEIKCGLEEIINIIDVLKIDSWSQINTTVMHKIRNDLIFKRIGSERLCIMSNKNIKYLDKYQVKLLKLLLMHILKEKIKYSTISSNSNNNTSQKTAENSNQLIQRKDIIKRPQNKPKVVEETKIINNTKVTIRKSMKKGLKQITGTIKFETKKAILLEVLGEETWVPKSVIKSEFKSWSKKEQLFYIDSWFFEKNPISIPS
jgi:hypothetical protein